MALPIEQISVNLAQEYQIPATTSATTGLALAFIPNSGGIATLPQTALVSAVGADITFKFGNSTSVTASTTVDGTLKTLPAGNFTVASGKTYSIRLNPRNQNFVSVKTATGSGTAVINLTTPIV